MPSSTRQLLFLIPSLDIKIKITVRIRLLGQRIMPPFLAVSLEAMMLHSCPEQLPSSRLIPSNPLGAVTGYVSEKIERSAHIRRLARLQGIEGEIHRAARECPEREETKPSLNTFDLSTSG